MPSTLDRGLDFLRDEHDTLLRIVDSTVSSNATLANGNSACRYRSVRGFSESRRMSDINGDSLSDFVRTSRAGTPFVAGRPRNLDGIDLEGLLIRRGPDSAFMSWQAVSGTNEYRVQVNNLYVADIAGDVTTLEVVNMIYDAAALYSVEAYDSDGLLLLTQQRRLPAYTSPVSELRISVYGVAVVKVEITVRDNQ